MRPGRRSRKMAVRAKSWITPGGPRASTGSSRTGSWGRVALKRFTYSCPPRSTLGCTVGSKVRSRFDLVLITLGIIFFIKRAGPYAEKAAPAPSRFQDVVTVITQTRGGLGKGDLNLTGSIGATLGLDGRMTAQKHLEPLRLSVLPLQAPLLVGGVCRRAGARVALTGSLSHAHTSHIAKHRIYRFSSPLDRSG